ncbi:MAG: hypothetical protein ISP32_08505 [Thermoleophilia bacterium]|nr:hypothetical protein [Thermoleophilia bacterium]
MRLATYVAAAALMLGIPVAIGGTTAQDCSGGACTVSADQAAWAQVAEGVKGGTAAYPRATRGALLRDIRLRTQQPREGAAPTVCDGRQQATARYVWRNASVTFINVTSAGQDCTADDPARYRCTTRTISGLGRTRDCTSSRWRILTWGRYVPRVGGQFQLSGPRAYPMVAVARSVR